MVNGTEEEARAYLDRGFAYYEKGDYDLAIEDYTEAIRLRPEYASFYWFRGDAYLKKGDYDRAVEDYTEAFRLDPKDYLRERLEEAEAARKKAQG